MRFDFATLAEGVKKNNLGLGGFRLWVHAHVTGGRARIDSTGQEFPCEGVPEGTGGAAPWRAFDVQGWSAPGGATLVARPGAVAHPPPPPTTR